MENSSKCNKWMILLAWQGCSILLCGIGTICTFLSNEFSTTLPCLMLTCSYCLIFLVSIYPKSKSDIPWWKYIVVGVTYFAGDYLSVLAYNYTSLASALLLVTTVIFYVAPISYFVFKRKISIWQFFSILLGFGGVVIVFLADNGGSNSRLLGDIIAIISAICYAISTVMQEYLVRSNEIRPYLFRFSATAAPLAGVFSGIIEHKSIKNFHWTTLSVSLIIGYAILLMAYDVISPIVMKHSNATEMNLSMLTSNFYSLLISILVFHQKANFLYLIGFCCVPIAIVIYTLGAPKEIKNEENFDSSSLLANENIYESGLIID